MRTTMTQWICAVLLCGVAGCGGPLAWFQAMVIGPDSVPAEFTFPEDPLVKVLVWVDDPHAGRRDVPIRQHLMEAINLDLKDKEIVAGTISNVFFTRYTASIPFFQKKMSTDKGILELGEALKVEYVFVVRVKEFHLAKNPADTVYEPYLETECRILNVHDEEQAWPIEQLWFQVEEIDRGTVTPGTERSFTSNLTKEMAREMSQRITNLFRTSPGRDPSSLPKKDPTHPEWEHPDKE
jgi:hypothetical protein